MPNYKLKQPVPWNKILRTLRFDIELSMVQYERVADCAKIHPFYDRAAKITLQDLQERLETYQSLRSFLGYWGTTKLEQEALSLLQQTPLEG